MAEAVGRNIILLSDGTGNSAGKLFKTNVWRIYDALDLSNASQIASYDDGVGTSSVKPLAVLGGAVGWGLKRNVLSLYTFLCLNYQPGDRNLCLWIQSRRVHHPRAHQLRPLARAGGELVVERRSATQGASPLPKISCGEDPILRPSYASAADPRWVDVDQGCRSGPTPPTDARSSTRPRRGNRVSRLVGHGRCLWVADRRTRQRCRSWIWPLSLGDKTLDGRNCRRPVMRLPSTTSERRFIPYCGTKARCRRCVAHRRRAADAGLVCRRSRQCRAADIRTMRCPMCRFAGSSPKRPEARRRFNPLAIGAVDVKVSPYGRIYNPRAGFGAYYRYDPRRLDPPRDRQGACIPEPKIHETVVWRMAMGTDAYAPLSLPNGVRVVTESRGGAKNVAAAGGSSTKRPNILAFDEYRAAGS